MVRSRHHQYFALGALLERFADLLEESTIATIESGTITGDLKNLLDVPVKTVVNTEEFLKAVATTLESKL